MKRKCTCEACAEYTLSLTEVLVLLLLVQLFLVFYIRFLLIGYITNTFFKTGSPTVVSLPVFNSSHVEVDLPDSYYLVYQETPEEGNYSLCVGGHQLPALPSCWHFTSNQTICRPQQHPLCLSAAFDSTSPPSNPRFGLSLFDIASNVTIYYILNAGSGESYTEVLSGASDLNTIWFNTTLDCFQVSLAVGIVIPIAAVFLVIAWCINFLIITVLCKRKRRIPRQSGRYSIDLERLSPELNLQSQECHQPSRDISSSKFKIPGETRSAKYESQQQTQSISPLLILPGNYNNSERRLEQLCWVPFDFWTVKIGQNGCTCYLTSHRHAGVRDGIVLELPSDAVDPGSTVDVRYSVIVDGPFKLPSGYKRGSMVVYVGVEGGKLTKPMTLHLPHWLQCSDPSLVKCCRAPHSLETGDEEYSFSLLSEECYKITETGSIIEVDGENCLFTVARREGVKECYQYQMFEKHLSEQEKDICIYVTFATITWRKIVNRFCRGDWEQLHTTYMNSFVINNESTTLQSTVNPVCRGDNWAINVNGSDTVSVEKFDFTKKSSIGYARSLAIAVRNRYYPPAFRYRMVQNQPPPGCLAQIRTVNIELLPTEPSTVKIPVDVIDFVPVGLGSDEVHTELPRQFSVGAVGGTPDSRESRNRSSRLDGAQPLASHLNVRSLRSHVIPIIVGEWDKFSIYLGVEHAVVKMIKRNHPGDCKGACEEMLKLWYGEDDGTGGRPREWSTVIDALDKTGFKEEARELKQRLTDSQTL